MPIVMPILFILIFIVAIPRKQQNSQICSLSRTEAPFVEYILGASCISEAKIFINLSNSVALYQILQHLELNN